MALTGRIIIVRADTLFPGGCTTTGNTFQPKTSLRRSSDGGRSWQQVTTFSAVLNMLRFTPRADSTGYYGVGLLASPSESPASASFTVLDRYFRFYNHERPHQALGYQTPARSTAWLHSGSTPSLMGHWSMLSAAWLS